MTSEQKMWWQAYLAALTGLGYREEAGYTQDADYARGAADEALNAYRQQWGQERLETRWCVSFHDSYGARWITYVEATDRDDAIKKVLDATSFNPCSEVKAEEVKL